MKRLVHSSAIAFALCISLIFNWGGVNALYAQGMIPLGCPDVEPCNTHPPDCRQIEDVYKDWYGYAPVDIRPCYFNEFSGGTLGNCNYIGEYQTLGILLPGKNETGTALSCLNSGQTGEVHVPYLSLLSFPFGMNTERSQNAETTAGCTNCKRILTIKEQLIDFNQIENIGNLYMLASIGFTQPPANSSQDEWTTTNTGRVIVPHSVIKHKIYTICNENLIDSIEVVVDNTRGRARFYPFKDCNDFNGATCITFNTEHDIAIVPFVQLNYTGTNPPSGFNYLNYFPIEEIPECTAFPCLSWDGISQSLNLCEYMHPVPYSLVSFHLRGNEGATFHLGYYPNATGGSLQLQSGIKHTYIVDKNFDITQINPSERIFYNPSEVHIEADNLVFPSGYSFVTARGTPPTLTDIDNTPCSAMAALDKRYLPVITDQPNTYYIKADNSSKEVRPSVYILEPGSKLTIEPCVHLYDMTIVVKPGAKLVYYPNQLYGNFDPATDIITDGEVPPSAITAINYQGACHDCRCEQTMAVTNGINIETEVEWEAKFLTITGQIVVKPGATLSIIDSELQFADSQTTGIPTGITVAPGGKLYLRNAKLTALNCHNMWDGIKIQGNVNQPQYPETNQGTLYIVGGIIEKARIAQSAGGEASVFGGGIIKAINATFRNNDIALLTGGYQPNSASIFRNCIFEQTKPIKHILNPDPGTYGQTAVAFAQVALVDSRGIKFVDCTFQNNAFQNKQLVSTPLVEGIGILAYLSDFYVGPDYWTTATPSNPNPLSTQSVIEGFFKGIDTYGVLGWDSRTTIWRTRFENNYYSYIGNGSNLDQITESEFYADFHESDNYFLFFHHATNYTVAGNTFEHKNPAGSSEFDGYGIHCHRTGPNNGGSIFDNKFKSLYQGVTVQGSNPNLQIKCNTYEGFFLSGAGEVRCPWVLKAFKTSNGTTTTTIEPLIMGNQGTSCGVGETAGNLFNDVEVEEDGRTHIYAEDEAQNPFTYFANITPQETIPIINGDEYEVNGEPYNVASVITNQVCLINFDAPTTCPTLPNLGGYPGGTGVGDGSPSDFAGHIKTTSGSNAAKVNRGAQATQHYLQNDSTRQEALAFLSAFNTPQAWRMLLGANLQQTDTAQIQYYRQLLQAEPDTDPYLIDYYKILADVISNRRNLHQLQIAEIQALEEIAQSASSAAVYAQSLLAMPTLSTYIRQTQPLQISGKKPYNTSIAPANSWLYPNPATHTISIHTKQPWQNLILYNLHGQEVASYVYTSNANTIELPQHLQNGMYIARLQLKDGSFKSAKLLISK